ncbi:MAG: hypothetical protein E6R03_18305 [Hyphomicrobiaceae bacterium]|nr:MAG: hypothetical protein E6R03_18305 [Hyphomicrobiaceae bacterium]
MEQVILRLGALYSASGEDWYNVKEEVIELLGVLIAIQQQKFNDQEIYLMRDGEYIQAIKAYRDRTLLTLKDAKAAVDKYMEMHQIPKKR